MIKATDKKKARKVLPKAKSLKNPRNDVMGGGNIAVSAPPCSGVYTTCVPN